MAGKGRSGNAVNDSKILGGSDAPVERSEDFKAPRVGQCGEENERLIGLLSVGQYYGEGGQNRSTKGNIGMRLCAVMNIAPESLGGKQSSGFQDSQCTVRRSAGKSKLASNCANGCLERLLKNPRQDFQFFFDSPTLGRFAKGSGQGTGLPLFLA